ncbi:MAG TPA: CHAP domain-containing protein [Polyangia bacterium]|nr:CHAP domain-containing protein [Polyangia bacterium]
MTLAEATIAYAKSQVGVQEHPRGSNAGPEVERYLAYVNLAPGKAWCAAFVSYCVGTSASDLSTTTTLKPSGGALALYFKNHPLAIDQPEPNCIGVIDHGKGLGHAFFVESVQDSTCHTIEGNADPAGGREGYMVAERDRHTADITYFLRIR